MNKYSASLLIVFFAIANPLHASAYTSAGVTSHMQGNHASQAKPVVGKITILSSNLSGDSVSVSNADRYSVILTKHDDGSLDFNLDQVDVSSKAGKSMNDKVVINILSVSQLEIDLAAVPSGVYVIKTKTGSFTVEKK
jgi:hypothetical protein